MKINDFKLERFFAKYEFNSPYLLCCSDCESFSIKDILALEGPDASDSFLNLWLGYTESLGHPELRRNIARLYQNINSKDVMVTAGAEEAIFLFMNCALDKGDHIIVQSPCYQSLFQIAESIGCEISKWQLAEENNWEPDMDWLESNIRKNTRAIIINSPHNPTGSLISADNLNCLAGLAAKHNIYIFSDEVYRFLEYSPADSSPALCDLYENAVSLGVMSKTYGLAGLRIGWIATRNNSLYRDMAAFKDYTSICNSAPSEYLATIALKHQHTLVNRNLQIINRNLALLDTFFRQNEDLFHWQRPKAGPIAFPSIRWNEHVENFCLDLVNHSGVLLLPGNHYDFGTKNFRIGFGRSNMHQALDKLQIYLSRKRASGTL